MIIAGVKFENSFVTIHNKEIDIHYRKKKFRVAIDKVTKMYLAKKKSRLSLWIPGMQSIIDRDYNLCIKTTDNKKISMDVKASEKQFFIDPIAMVRKLNKKNHMEAAS